MKVESVAGGYEHPDFTKQHSSSQYRPSAVMTAGASNGLSIAISKRSTWQN
jgi:hypothetical protein